MQDSDVLTIRQVARELDLDERTIRRAIKSGELLHVGFDLKGRYLISRSDLNDFIRRRRQGRNGE